MPGLLPQFALRRRDDVLVGIDAALRHLPLEPRDDGLRSITDGTAGEDQASGVEQRDADVGAKGQGFGRRHGQVSRDAAVADPAITAEFILQRNMI